jgi:DNA-binding NarL/FixJ family response regulator
MKKVLIIDDDISVKRLIREEIKEKGGNIDIMVCANSGKEGISKYIEIRPVFVFLDMRMPGSDGLETFKSIINFDRDANVFIVTGYPEDSASDAIKLGAKGYISKSSCYVSMIASLVIAIESAMR